MLEEQINTKEVKMLRCFNRFVFCFLVTLLLTAAAAFAQSSFMLKGKVPFDFQVDTVVMPAGEYIVQTGYSGGAISIHTPDHSKGVWILTNPLARNHRGRGEAKLCFKRYRDRYFLSQVWDDDGAYGRSLPPGRLEKELAASIRPATTNVVMAK
jgi:hypothetical protein